MKTWNVELSKEMYDLFNKLFTSLGLKMPDNINESDMKEVLRRLELVIKASKTARLKQVNDSMKISAISDPITNIARELDVIQQKQVEQKVESYPKNVMVISQTGIIRYQLKSLFAKHKIDTFVDENQYRGLAEYVKKLFEVVILDNPGNVSEVLDVVEEIKRISEENSVKTKVIILLEPKYTPLKDKLKIKGVDNVVIKEDDWYPEILRSLKTVYKQLVTI